MPASVSRFPAVPHAARIGASRRAAPFALSVLVVLVCAMSIVALCIGAYRIPLAQAWAALSGDPTAQQARAVLVGIRAPRVVLALLVGAGFGAAGAAMQ
ncbi:iron chelate uptake ABC transporter family permease subunit, partial [Burkholderia dolosa]